MNFNPLPPHGGRPIARHSPARRIYFNPLPPHGGRPITQKKTMQHLVFQSTPSAWRETAPFHRPRKAVHPFQSTPSAWRETTALCMLFSSGKSISIHSLRMEGDGGAYCKLERVSISIHSLRMEGDGANERRGAGYLYFNPLPPHGGRHFAFHQHSGFRIISIHSLRMEGDKNLLQKHSWVL